MVDIVHSWRYRPHRPIGQSTKDGMDVDDATLDFEQALARGEDVDALAAAWALSQNEQSLAWLKVGNGWAGEHVSRGIWIFYEVLLLL